MGRCRRRSSPVASTGGPSPLQSMSLFEITRPPWVVVVISARLPDGLQTGVVGRGKGGREAPILARLWDERGDERGSSMSLGFQGSFFFHKHDR